MLLLLFIAALTAVYGSEHAPTQPDALLLERARQGSAQAQLEAGFAFFKLNNPIRAAYWFSAAARQGIPEAQYNMGRCHLEGYGVEKNQHLALEYFQAAAQKSLAPAELELAKLYLTGIAANPDATPPRNAVTPDEKKAFELLEKLSEQKNIDALLIYIRYLLQKGDPSAPGKVVSLMEKAVKLDDDTARIMLSDYLLRQSDSLRDEKRARALLEKAAERSPEAMAKLAFITEHGFGAPPQPEKAFKLYLQAMEKSFSPLAAARLANYYFSGKHGARQDVKQAVKLYTQAAAAGLPDAMTKLGDCFSSGIVLEQDHEQAFELYFRAAKMDYPPAAYALGKCFEQGKGTAIDQQAAFYWFNQAAMRQDPRAMLEVGKRFLSGQGTLPDAGKALIFLTQAYNNGMNEALNLIQQAKEQLKRENPPVEPQVTPRFKLQNTVNR